MQKYYGVYAHNGLGVFSSYARLMDIRPSLVQEKVRSFSDVEEAGYYGPEDISSFRIYFILAVYRCYINMSNNES